MKYKETLLYFVFLSSLCSCSNLFIQKSVFVPLITHKGETKAEASCGKEGVNLNSAYAFSDNFCLMANGFSAFNNSSQYQNRTNFQAELGIGYYKTLQDSFTYETFIGASRGWVNSTYERFSDEFGRYNNMNIFSPVNASVSSLAIPSGHNYTVNGYGNYFTTFMQHSFGMGRTSTNWNSFAWTIRTQYIKFDQYQETIKSFSGNNIYNVYSPDKLFIQFLITDKIGITNDLLFTLQIGINFDVTETVEVFQWNKLFCSLGAEYNFHFKEKNIRKVHFKKRYRNLFQRGY